MKRPATISFLCLLLTAFLAITLTGCPVTPPDTGQEGEQIQEGETVTPVEGEAPTEGEGEIDQPSEGEHATPTEGEGENRTEGEAAPSKTETIMLPGNVPLVMVWIPAGTFLMGGQESGPVDALPQHQVTLSHGFWMGEFELTQAQWKAVMNDNPSYFQGENADSAANTDNRPVEQVSWENITGSFLPTLNTVTGKSFRLPTEAEWEYAARAGTQTRFYWGDDPVRTGIGAYAWYHYNSDSQTHDVGGKLPNDFGLYDISGNVWERVQDWYGDYASGSVTDPTGPATGSNRVIRGGNWLNKGYCCWSAYRAYSNPSSAGSDIGFRLARSSE